MLSKFQLLHTPHVVLARIINSKDIPELIYFSMLSRKCNMLVKTLLNNCLTHEWSIGIHYDSIEIYGSKCRRSLEYCINIRTKLAKKLENVNFSGRKMRFSWDGGKQFHAYFDTVESGIRSMTDYLCDLFRVNVTSLKIGTNELWTIDWIKKRQTAPIMFGVFVEKKLTGVSDEQYSYVLNNLTPTIQKQMTLKICPQENFEYSGVLPKVYQLFLGYAYWLKIDNLLTFDICSFVGYGLTLTCSDMNSLLKHWLVAHDFRLKSFMGMWSTNFLDEVQVLDGLEDQLSRFNENRTINGKNFDSGYDLQRSDGVVASIVFSARTMHFMVWPDAERNIRK